MGKSSPTPPPVPDPNELINAQTDQVQVVELVYFYPYFNSFLVIHLHSSFSIPQTIASLG